MHLAIDQGYCCIYAINERAGFGIVDEARGTLNALCAKIGLRQFPSRN